MTRSLFALLLSVTAALIGVFAPADAQDAMPLQRRFCEGMRQEQRVPLGGRVDCINNEYAIEVEWAEDWYHAVGQSLYYAAVMKRKPAIILICPDASDHGEGLCRSYIYRLEAALSLVTVPVMVWECFAEDPTLADCFVPVFERAPQPAE